jgi:transcriptional regulator with PAS, ATPase and Fis domain
MRDRFTVARCTENEAGQNRPSVESGFVGVSALIKKSLQMARIAAPVDAPVLLQGETGTGKELLARFVHELSTRKTASLVTHNCAATPDGLLESELFGHKRGAFTGAWYERKGLIEEANGGTLFLDEMGDASPGFQARLLRVLQDGCFKRVGENITRRSDFRVIAATNRDLAERVSEGAFRKDLYYRLNVFQVYLPPLRERPEDVKVLAVHLARKHSRGYKEISQEALKSLSRYDWPGNVRELENEIVRSIAVSGEDPIKAHHLSARVRISRYDDENVSSFTTLRDIAADVERGVVAEALARYGGNRTRAARSLGLSRQGLTKKMRRLGLSI